MSALLFGLPLLTAYYAVNPTFFVDALVPYLAFTTLLALFLIARSGQYSQVNSIKSSFAQKFNSLPSLVIFIFLVWTAAFYSIVAYMFNASYPFPLNSNILTPIGGVYIILIIVTSILGFTRILYRAFPVLRSLLEDRKYLLMTGIFSLAFAAVYLLLVNQIIVAGYNVKLTAPPYVLGGGYPTVFAMAPAVTDRAVDLVYLPILIVQLNTSVNLIVIPFEMVFATVLSLLVGSNIALAHYLITHSGLRCSTKGTVLSTGGSILGLTATCPTCLAPTLVSVIFGGVASVATIYSNVYGVIIPPVLSLVALLAGIIYISRKIKGLGAVQNPQD